MLERFRQKPVNVGALVAARRYEDAMTLIGQEMKRRPNDTALRMQSAEVLLLLGKSKNAISLLDGLADEFASMGFAAKAIAVLKKIQRIDPAREDIGYKLVELIKSGDLGASRVRSQSDGDIGIGALMGELTDPSPARIAEPALSATIATPADINDEPEEISVEFMVAEDETVQAKPRRLVSPLFAEFSDDELFDVMRGLNLVTFEPGDVIVSEGEEGNSLFILSTGAVNAFIGGAQGRKVKELKEGEFFGEGSLLTGKPRMATIVAATSCELLVLDRPTLGNMIARRPHIRTVLEHFYNERLNQMSSVSVEQMDGSATAMHAGLVKTAAALASRARDKDAPAGDTSLDDLRKLAIEYTRIERWPDAIKMLRQYLEVRPTDTSASTVLALVYGKLDRWREAVEVLTVAARANMNEPTVFLNLGLAYQQLEMLPHATAAFKQALKLKPDYVKAQKALQTALENAARRQDAGR